MLPIEIVKALEGAINHGEFALARSFLNDDLLYAGPFGEKVGRESYLSDIIRLKITFRTSQLIADGDNVAAVYEVILAGLTTPALGWFGIRDGKVSSLRTAFDPRPIVMLLESQSASVGPVLNE